LVRSGTKLFRNYIDTLSISLPAFVLTAEREGIPVEKLLQRSKSMKLYKLTDENDRTYNNTQWGENVTHTASGKGDLCGPGWLHAYTNPLLAVLLNPIHAGFKSPHLWEAEGRIYKTDKGLKVSTKKLATIRRMKLPPIYATQRIAFGILCAKKVYTDKKFVRWANEWLSGKNRSETAAWAAYAAANAANAAAYAANAAAYAAYAAAYAAANAANAAAYAANAAAYAADKSIDLVSIAHKAMKVK
jgi:hypothetical protein